MTDSWPPGVGSRRSRSRSRSRRRGGRVRLAGRGLARAGGERPDRDRRDRGGGGGPCGVLGADHAGSLRGAGVRRPARRYWASRAARASPMDRLCAGEQPPDDGGQRLRDVERLDRAAAGGDPARLAVDPRRGGREVGEPGGSSPSSGPWVASSAPSTPPSTSPEPAVASHGCPARTADRRPEASATNVVAPFSSTVTPVSAAARTAQRSGSAATSSLDDVDPDRLQHRAPARRSAG